MPKKTKKKYRKQSKIGIAKEYFLRDVKQLKNAYLAITKFFNRITPKFLQNYLAFWLPLLFLACLPPLTDWVRDRNQVLLSDLLLPLILAFITSTILALIFYRFFTKNRFIALLAAIGVYFVISQRIDTKLQPIWNLFRSSKFISKIIDLLGSFKLFLLALIFFILLYFLLHFIDKAIKSRKWDMAVLFRVAVVTVSVAFIIQLFSVLQIVIIEWPQFFYRPAELASKDVNANPDKKPDIYYIVLDRYTNQNVLKDQLGFDNSDFTTFLEDKGFSINSNAYDNYPNTALSISSTLKANYHSDLAQIFGSASLQTVGPYFNSVYYSPIIKELKRLGYSYYHLGSYYEISNQAPLSDHDYQSGNQLNVLGRAYPLNEFPQKELLKSIYGYTAKKGLKIGNFSIFSFTGLNQRDQSLFDIEKLKEIPDENTGPKFVFAHILVPHNPYFFNADGSFSDNPWVDNVGKPIGEKYVGQVEFINSQMKEVINKIEQKTDNQAVIIIQADEGPYPSQEKMPPDGTAPVDPEMNESDKTQRSREDFQMKYGILAAYHIPQATNEDLSSGGDSVNIFRLVLNTYFGYNLPYLPRCYYGINSKKELLKYVDITEKLTGLANPDCPNDGIFTSQ